MNFVDTKEFHYLRTQFEKDIKVIMYIGRLDREEKDMYSKGYFYQDGEVNKLFKVYMMGYQSHKCISNL